MSDTDTNREAYFSALINRAKYLKNVAHTVNVLSSDIERGLLPPYKDGLSCVSPSYSDNELNFVFIMMHLFEELDMLLTDTQYNLRRIKNEMRIDK